MNNRLLRNTILGAGGMLMAFFSLTTMRQAGTPPAPVYKGHLSAPSGKVSTDLKYFKADFVGKEVVLTWEASNELALTGYQIERSNDGQDFQRIGWVYCREITNEPFYEFIDSTIKEGQAYHYRLKMVDFDGRLEYSPVRVATPQGF